MEGLPIYSISLMVSCRYILWYLSFILLFLVVYFTVYGLLFILLYEQLCFDSNDPMIIDARFLRRLIIKYYFTIFGRQSLHVNKFIIGGEDFLV